jgi:hypothetical protein
MLKKVLEMLSLTCIHTSHLTDTLFIMLNSFINKQAEGM